MVIKWSDYSKKDLHEFYNFSKMQNPIKYLKELINYIDEELKLNPRLGKIYDYSDNTIIRQLIYKQHKIFYYIEKDKIIHIITIIHYKQDTKSKLEYIKRHI